MVVFWFSGRVGLGQDNKKAAQGVKVALWFSRTIWPVLGECHMTSKSPILLFLAITSCSTPTVWQTDGGVLASEEEVSAAKETCDYENKRRELAAYERDSRELSNVANAYPSIHDMNHEIEFRIAELLTIKRQVENELTECMSQQNLVQSVER